MLQALKRVTDLTLVPGTLNVRLPQPFDGTLTGYLTEDDLGGTVWGLVRIWRPGSAGQAMTIGLMWLGMTVAFELLFGHYVAKRPWRELLRDYNLCAGRVWLVVLVWVTLTPYLFYQLQK